MQIFRHGKSAPHVRIASLLQHARQPGRRCRARAIRRHCGQRKRFASVGTLLAGALMLVTHSAMATSSSDTVYEVRGGNDRVYTANPDHDSVAVVDAVTRTRIAEIPVGDDPRGVALDNAGNLWVTNRGDDSISIISTNSLAVTATVPGPRASQPYGIVIDNQNGFAYVALSGLGQVLQLSSVNAALINTATINGNIREISLTNNGQHLLVPLFITPPINGESGLNPAQGAGQIQRISTNSMTLSNTITLPYNGTSNNNDTNANARGVANYLRAPAVMPNGATAWVPAKLDNIYRGTRRDGRARQHNFLTRGMLAHIDLVNGNEIVADRIQFPDNNHPTAVAVSNNGQFLFVVHEGSRALEAIRISDRRVVFSTTLGFAPIGVAISNDDSRVFVHNWLSRSLSVLDTAALTNGSSNTATLLGAISLRNSEALTSTLLTGKRLFHDSADTRISGQRYISCASCHADGGQDGRVWDFSDVGEGLRNTTELRGRGNMQDGLVHWTANFDEIHDFEHALREIFGGTGLMTNSDFAATATPIDPAGMKQGRSADLDALVAFIGTMNGYGISPFRNGDGSLTAQASNGRALFAQYQCAACHAGNNFSDSETGGSHNIGTVDSDTGGRFGQPLINGGLDTPPLKGIWQSPPYLHDGAAATIASAISAHTQNMPVSVQNLSAAELNDLQAYVLQIDDTEPAPDTPEPPDNGGFSTFANISIDGNLADWPAAAVIGNDPQDATGGSNRLDYQRAWFAHNDANLFIRYDNHAPNNTLLTWGYAVGVDVDGPSNGFRGIGNGSPIGIDYLVEAQSVYRYTGNGTSWAWAWVTNYPITFSGRSAELAISRTVFGNPATLDFFLYADNNAVGGTAVDFFPDAAPNQNAALETRFFSYSFGDSGPPPPPPPPPSPAAVFYNPLPAISVNGNLSEWGSVTGFPADPNDVNGNTNTIDFLQAWMGHRNSDFYVAWQNDGNTAVTWGNALFLDTDLNFNTGFRGFSNESPIGIDYLAEANAVYRYTGNGNSWAWQYVGATQVATRGNNLELRIPATLVGNPTTMDALFYGDSSALGGNGIDFYPDAATNPAADIAQRRFRYTRDASQSRSAPATRISDARTPATAAMHSGGSGGAGSAGLSLALLGAITAWRRRHSASSQRRYRHAAQRLPIYAAAALLAACGGDSSVVTPSAETDLERPSTTVTFVTDSSVSKSPSSSLGMTETSLDAASTLDALQARVFTPVCSGCHIGGGEELPSQMDLTTADASFASLVNTFSIEVPATVRVQPGVAGESYLVQKIEGSHSVGARMPMRAAPLDAETILAIRAWIDGGAER